ncbi:MAG: hypothetical protein ACRDBI_03260 [Shewanella sp.]
MREEYLKVLKNISDLWLILPSLAAAAKLDTLGRVAKESGG